MYFIICFYDYDLLSGLEAKKGQPNPTKLTITPSGDNSGVLEGNGLKPINFTYDNGIIKAGQAKGGDSVKIELIPIANDTGYQINGKVNIIIRSGMARVESTLSLNR